MWRVLIIVFAFLAHFELLAEAVSQEVELDTGSGQLYGTMLSSADTQTVALIIAGSGPTDRNGNGPNLNNNALKMLAEELSEQGIASLRYDKRGVAQSQGAGLSESELRFEHYVDDAKRWVNYLHKLGTFKHIAIIGHSEGSLIGMLAAQQAEVGKFVSLSGVGQSIDQTIAEQLKAQPAFVLRQAIPILEKLRQGQTVDEVLFF